MDAFRWVLVVVGMMVLLVIYGLYCLEKRYPHWFGQAPVADQPKRPFADADQVIYIHLRARQGLMHGVDILRVMEKYHLVYGERQIFHYLAEEAKQPVFSVTNMIEPGYFDLTKLNALKTPGITLFLQPPGTLDVLHALDEMWNRAQSFARELDADILDRHYELLSAQKQQSMRDEVLERARQMALQGKIDESDRLI